MTSSSVCINDKADINCGFQGANPTDVEVIWYIARQNSRVMTVPTNDILTPTNGLQWVLDVSSGNDRSPHSKLIVGRVGEEHHRSTYQCSIGLPGEPKINSAIETLIVVGMIIIILYIFSDKNSILLSCIYICRSSSQTKYHDRNN